MDNQVKNLIKSLLSANGYNVAKMAKELNTTNQNLNQKINNGSIRVSDLLDICNILDVDIRFVDKVK